MAHERARPVVAGGVPVAQGEALKMCRGRLVKHARYYWLLLAEGHLTAALRRHAAEDLGAASAGRIAGDRLPRNSGEEMAQERRGVDKNAL